MTAEELAELEAAAVRMAASYRRDAEENTSGNYHCARQGCSALKAVAHTRLCQRCHDAAQEERNAARRELREIQDFKELGRGYRWPIGHWHANKAVRRAALGLPPVSKAPRVRYSGPPRKGYVYRLFDAQGRLLYIGKTYNVRARLWGRGGHAHTKPWWPEVASVTATEYRTEEAALDAEAWAIRREKPLHNVERPHPRTPRAPRRLGVELLQIA